MAWRKKQTKIDTTTTIAFDLMNSLATPSISTGVAYYKKQLRTYCLGIHSLTTGQAHIYLWHEGVVSKKLAKNLYEKTNFDLIQRQMRRSKSQYKICIYLHVCDGLQRFYSHSHTPQVSCFWSFLLAMRQRHWNDRKTKMIPPRYFCQMTV